MEVTVACTNLTVEAAGVQVATVDAQVAIAGLPAHIKNSNRKKP